MVTQACLTKGVGGGGDDRWARLLPQCRDPLSPAGPSLPAAWGAMLPQGPRTASSFGHFKQWPSCPGPSASPQGIVGSGFGPQISRASPHCPCLGPTAALPSAGTGRALATHISSQEEKPQPPPPPFHD